MANNVCTYYSTLHKYETSYSFERHQLDIIYNIRIEIFCMVLFARKINDHPSIPSDIII